MGRGAKRADRLRTAAAALWLLVCAGGVAACSARPRLTIGDGVQAVLQDVDHLRQQYPLAASDNIRAQPLGHSDTCSYSFIQIRRGESPHVHVTHDVTVTLLRGSGRLHIGNQSVDMAPGDVAYIAHGTRHYFVNTGAEPAAAFAMFAPAYDGRDQVPVAEVE